MSVMSMNRRSFLQHSGLAVGVSAAACFAPHALGAGLQKPTVPDVVLLDDQSRKQSLQQLIAKRTVAINFIYTGCASFCPPQTAIFRAVQSRMNEALREASYAPLLISISIDPLNDTPEQLARYAARFDAKLGLAQSWMMLTGDPAAIAQTVRAFGALGAIAGLGPASAGSAQVEDHPAQIWIGCAPRARWRSVASLPSADDVLRLMKEAAA